MDDVQFSNARMLLESGNSVAAAAQRVGVPASTLREHLRKASGSAPEAAPDADRSPQAPPGARNGAYKLLAQRRRAQRKVEKACANGSDDLKAVDAFLASLGRLERLKRLLG